MPSKLLAASAILTSFGLAQTASAPQLGFIADHAAHRLHALLGVPGAAHVGPELDLGESVSPESVSPRGDYVFVLMGQDRRPGLWLPETGARAISDAKPGPDKIALSPEGAAAALYYRDQNKIITINGLPDAPCLSAYMYLNSADAPIRTLAVSDDGKLSLFTPSDGGQVGQPSARVFSGSGELNRVWLSGTATAVTFGSKSHDAVVAGDSEAILIRDIEASAQQIRLPASNLGIVTAAVIAPGGHQVILASPDLAKVSIIQLERGNPSLAQLACDCSPSELARINGEFGYRLTPYSGGVSWVLDTSSRPPRLLAVPSLVNTDNY